MDLGQLPFPLPIPVSGPIDTLSPTFSWQQPWLKELVNQPNRPDCGGARLSGNRSAACVGNFSSRYVRIFLMITGSSVQAMTLAVPPQTRHVSTSISPKAPTVGENPLQPLRPGYCHEWHVCRFCRSKNRSWPHDVELAFSHPGHPLLWACCLFPVLQASPAHGAYCSERQNRR